MTPDFLAALSGLILSLAFSYIPGLKTWYDGQTGQAKSLVMLAALVVAAGVVYGAACAGLDILSQSVVCGDWRGLVRIFFIALVANQSIYLSTRKIGE